MRSRKLVELKYKIAWYLGTLLSFILFFSGIVSLYTYFRRKYSRQYFNIVLTYHRINDGGDDRNISVPLRKFENQIAYLKKNYDILSLDDLIYNVKHPHSKHDDAAVITFDDGYKDNYEKAYPELVKYSIPAAIFITTEFIDQPNGLNVDEIKEMQNNNITIGAHTRTHQSFSDLDDEKAHKEISGSKSDLEEMLGNNVEYFAYPYGKKGQDFSEATMEIVKKAGFRAAFSTNNGCITHESNLFALERIGVRNIPMFVFKVRLSGIFENPLFNVVKKLLKI